jgi:biotin synthase
MQPKVSEITERILDNGMLLSGEALELASLAGQELFDLFLAASRIKEHFVGNRVHLCSIINAKSGRCREDCAFCAQSVHHETDAPLYPLVEQSRILEAAREAEESGSGCFGIVTSGTTIGSDEELDRVCAALRLIRNESDISPSCSLGIIDRKTAMKLKEAGAVTYHHNLETARSFFPNICTTHDYEEDVATVMNVKEAGLRVCCGGIFGMGESMAQRIELAFTLRELNVDSVPINFLNPIPGTRLAEANFLTPLECLHTIALFRLILPAKKITICGGREKNLRDLQSWMFLAGANGTMIGNYLTTSGRDEARDRQMLKDLGLEIAVCGC